MDGTLDFTNVNWKRILNPGPGCNFGPKLHSGIYGHKNKTQILEIVAFIVQFYTYFNTYDMN